MTNCGDAPDRDATADRINKLPEDKNLDRYRAIAAQMRGFTSRGLLERIMTRRDKTGDPDYVQAALATLSLGERELDSRQVESCKVLETHAKKQANLAPARKRRHDDKLW